MAIQPIPDSIFLMGSSNHLVATIEYCAGPEAVTVSDIYCAIVRDFGPDLLQKLSKSNIFLLKLDEGSELD